jgi:hypothetical protein
MTDGLQRTCPACAELNHPDRVICSECGAWLIEPKHLNEQQLASVLEDWYRADRPPRVDHETDDPDLWMPHWKPRGGAPTIPPRKES